ncbi:MAG: 3-phosphoshikimate 1-carboxyvinyltransferase [Acidobacteriota bacterium]
MSRKMRISHSPRMQGALRVPGDKSISHRALMFASIARGTSRIEGLSSSEDCRATLECIRRLGIETEQHESTLIIHGRGLKGYRPSPVPLDAGNSGSTMRMLSGLLAAQPFTTVIDGDESLRRRPMARIIEPLEMMGARIEARDGRFAPLTIRGAHLKAISYTSRVASAQIKSCVLLAALCAEGKTAFREPAPSRNHTELMLEEFGARFAQEDGWMTIEGGAELRAVNYRVPGDPSSAAFFVAAATLLPDSEILIEGVALNPTRMAFLDVMTSLGAKIERENLSIRHGEAVGDLRVRSAELRSERPATVLSGSIIPNLIDEIPALAVVGARTAGRIEIRDAAELRIKESDRIRTICDGIRAMGGEIEEFEDGFAIIGPQRLKGGAVQTAGDHRIAMAFSVAGLVATGATIIEDAECAAVSFPEFYRALGEVAGEGAIDEIE